MGQKIAGYALAAVLVIASMGLFVPAVSAARCPAGATELDGHGPEDPVHVCSVLDQADQEALDFNEDHGPEPDPFAHLPPDDGNCIFDIVCHAPAEDIIAGLFGWIFAVIDWAPTLIEETTIGTFETTGTHANANQETITDEVCEILTGDPCPEEGPGPQIIGLSAAKNGGDLGLAIQKEGPGPAVFLSGD